MSRSLNKVLIIGNLTKDPVVRFTAKGSPVASFSVATNRSWTSPEGGEKKDEVEFHNMVVWGKLAEICDKYLKKGDKAYFEGRLQTRKWQGEDGNDRYSTEIVVENMLMLGAKSGSAEYDDSESQAPKRSSKKKDTQEMNSQVSEVEDISDDIPF